MAMLYRVNAGAIPKDHWIQDKEIGGGRLIGEVCHFIDFLIWLCGALPVNIYAQVLPDPDHLQDTVSLNLEFGNGSIGTICYFANGSKTLPKEYIEVYSGGVTGIIRDFREIEIHSTGRPRRKKSYLQDKGQARMVATFIDRLKQGGPPLIAPEEIFATTAATFTAMESLGPAKLSRGDHC
jgi:predicted dehydrogenase